MQDAAMRPFVILALLLTGNFSARAATPFELQCGKAFDAIADTTAGGSWKGANKPRFCACLSGVTDGSAAAVEAYNAGTAPVSVDGSVWDCYEKSDLTTKRRR